MAWTEKYVSALASGGGDGSSGNPWTLAEGITNEAAGMRLNVLAGTYANTSTTRTFAGAGITTAPIWWRGYKTTIGDQDSNNVAVAGTDIPSFTFTTGQMVVSGAQHIFSSLDINSACVTSGGAVAGNATSLKLYRVRITNTAANAQARALTNTSAGTSLVCVACYFKATSSAIIILPSAASQSFEGCIFTGGTNAFNNGQANNTLINCVFDSQGSDAIAISGTNLTVANCSFYAPAGNGINFTTAITAFIINNYFENVNQALKAAINNTSGTNTNLVTAVSNTYYNCTTNTLGLGDSPLIFDNGTLGSAGFLAPGSQNFALNGVAQKLGFPGKFENTAIYQGYLSNGAVQPSGTMINQGEY